MPEFAASPAIFAGEAANNDKREYEFNITIKIDLFKGEIIRE